MHCLIQFSSSLKVDFQKSRVTSDAVLLLVRELDERLGLSQFIADNLTDVRHGKNTQLHMSELLHQSIYSRLVGDGLALLLTNGRQLFIRNNLVVYQTISEGYIVFIPTWC